MLGPAGEVKDMAVPWLFQELKTAKKTCAVIFEQDKLTKTVYFKDGDLLFASSTGDNDRLTDFLLSRGRITREQFDAVNEAVVKTKKKVGTVLFEMGLLSPKDLVEQVKLQIRQIILELFSWRQGGYRVETANFSSEEIIPLQLNTAGLILEGVQSLDWQLLKKRLPSMSVKLHATNGETSIFKESDLSPDQKTVLALIDGRKTVEEICMLSGIGDFNALKAIYLLCSLKLAGAGERKTEAEMAAARADAARAARTASQPKPDDQPATRDMVLKAFNEMKHQDDYQVLGVSASTSPEELKKVYFKLAKRYHPDIHLAPEMDDVKTELGALFSRIHDAYQRLSGTERKEGQGQYEERHAEDYVENYAEKMKKAVTFFNAGMKEFGIGNFWGAADKFAAAARFDPVNATYSYYLGMSLMNIPRRRHEAEENLQKAIEIDPLKPDYYIELGGLYLKSGLKNKALDVYIAALRDNPNSEKIKEAIKNAGGTIPKGSEESAGIFKKLFKEKK